MRARIFFLFARIFFFFRGGVGTRQLVWCSRWCWYSCTSVGIRGGVGTRDSIPSITALDSLVERSLHGRSLSTPEVVGMVAPLSPPPSSPGGRPAPPRMLSPKVPIFRGSWGVLGTPQNPPPGDPPKSPPETPQKWGVLGAIWGGLGGHFWPFLGVLGTPRKCPKNAEKMGTFSACACESGRGWGGSAHYPDPTAQSVAVAIGREFV